MLLLNRRQVALPNAREGSYNYMPDSSPLVGQGYAHVTPNQAAASVVVFVTDEGYSLPTIIAAKYARQHVAPALADIAIVSHSLKAQGRALIAHAAKAGGVRHIPLEGRPWEDIDLSRYNPTHVPPSALARFFLPDSITRAYDRILYLDGDVMPLADLRPLMQMPLGSGAFGAAEDRAFFYARELGPTGERTRAYFKRLDVQAKHGYFNSGVLLADGETWIDLSRDAFRFFRLKSADCLYHDQSALNAVAGDRRVRLSPRWNFQSDYFGWGLKSCATPLIAHFAGGDKPWRTATPTLQQFSQRYSHEIDEVNRTCELPDGAIAHPFPAAFRSDRPSHPLGGALSTLRNIGRRQQLVQLDSTSKA